jgi:hypothetical protein
MRRVLAEYVEYYNSLSPPPEPSGLIHGRKILGGIINEHLRNQEDAVVSRS